MLLAAPATTRPMQNARKTRSRHPGARAPRRRPTMTRIALSDRSRRRERERPRHAGEQLTRRARARRRGPSRRAAPARRRERGQATLGHHRAEHEQQAAPADEGGGLVEEGRGRRDVEGDQRRKRDRCAGEHGEDRVRRECGVGLARREWIASEEAVGRQIAEDTAPSGRARRPSRRAPLPARSVRSRGRRFESRSVAHGTPRRAPGSDRAARSTAWTWRALATWTARRVARRSAGR